MIDVGQQIESSYRRKISLIGRKKLVEELVGWLREKDVSIRQAIDALEIAKDSIEEAWHMQLIIHVKLFCP